jgi:hypothetical protein
MNLDIDSEVAPGMDRRHSRTCSTAAAAFEVQEALRRPRHLISGHREKTKPGHRVRAFLLPCVPGIDALKFSARKRPVRSSSICEPTGVFAGGGFGRGPRRSKEVAVERCT